MRYLVLGGAGYIGSIFTKEAIRRGHEVTVFDNLSTGNRHLVPKEAHFINGDLLDNTAISEVRNGYDAVFHFAAKSLVGESNKIPLEYYRNNVEGVRNLLSALSIARKCPILIFSSTCAIYGIPEKLPITEEEKKSPISSYGKSKLMAEMMIEDAAKANNMHAIALRYFNACGAELDGSLGEAHEPETHLIPCVIKSALLNHEVIINGNDFPTNDGTCVRDYIHVLDLADAHIKAAEYLIKRKNESSNTFDYFNLGTGRGYSNLEILKAVEAELGKKINYVFGPRRLGDPSELWANPEKIIKFLNFKANYSDLSTIISSAVKWHKNNID